MQIWMWLLQRKPSVNQDIIVKNLSNRRHIISFLRELIEETAPPAFSILLLSTVQWSEVYDPTKGAAGGLGLEQKMGALLFFTRILTQAAGRREPQH